MSPEYVGPVLPSYSGPQLQYPGPDQINLELPRSLAGAGAVTVKVSVGGSFSKTGFLAFR